MSYLDRYCERPHFTGPYCDLRSERERQEAKFPDQHLPDGTTRGHRESAERAKKSTDKAAADGSLTWWHVLREEVYEAAAEEDPSALRAELIQVAAVAVRWVEDIDRRASDLGEVPNAG